FAQAIALAPEYGDALRNLGKSLVIAGRAAEAIDPLRRAIRASPALLDAHLDLVQAHQQLGQFAEAVQCLRRVVAMRPDDAAVRSQLIHAMQLDPRCDGAEIGHEMDLWMQRHGAAQSAAPGSYSNSRDPDRRLRLGYVLAQPHPNFERLLAAHDHSNFQIVVYSNVRQVDPATRHMQRFADEWRRIAGRTDEDVVRAIRMDEIDILIDTAGHARGNRLLVLAKRPAPVQVWVGNDPGWRGDAYRDWPAEGDVAQRVREMEAGYRALWRRWCEG
ncbi:MAG TPA: tetratricopeptide repeat protein, partial [Bryobacteraceae bacterium]|nr:tetratricopeptide repeat protein [Bryobacteraceae bacterium]